MSLQIVAFTLMLVVAGPLAAATMREIDWLEMIPADELSALENGPSIDHSGGGMEQLMTSVNTVAKMHGVRGKLPGYAVPLNSNDDGAIIDFFFVPYFGACMHMPPPPPNQIVYVKPKQPLMMGGDYWSPYWAIGTLRTEVSENAAVTAAYVMELESLEVMEEEP